ncbi:hypothetical protein ACFQ14_15495 [Pseudahrensia aquimaris]|uniref:Uncharacterized protein n=1 Tax=Pseudahrensia aquimaris TaxID=744461 RepID=A0ABW3FJU9_9HYPH
MSDAPMDRHMVHHTSQTGSAIVYRGLVSVIFIFSIAAIAAGRLAGRAGQGSIWSEARANAHAAAGYAVKY